MSDENEVEDLGENDKDYIITHDLNPERYNLYLEKGIVVDVKFF